MYIELVEKNEYFSWVFESNLYNHVRNSIGHFNYMEDALTQEVTFIDSHKGNEKVEKRYLVDIGDSCVKMFFSLINVMELNYSLMKIHYIMNFNKN